MIYAVRIMRTKCYCTHCPKHPKFDVRHSFEYPVTGFEVHKFISPDFDDQAATVNCLEPFCGAIKDGTIDPEDYDFPVTAYGDGSSYTGFWNIDGLSVHAVCLAERYEK